MKYSNEVKIGVLVVAGLVALVWGINYLKGTDVLSKRNEYFAVYKQVSNLNNSNDVKLNGIRIGFVSDMKFLDDKSGRVLVSMLIDKNIYIPKRSIAMITDEDFLGGKAIIIRMSGETEAALDGDTLIGRTQLGLTEELGDQIEPLRFKAENLMLSIDTLATALGLLFDDENRKSIGSTMKNLNRLTAGQGKIDEVMDNLIAITGNLKSNSEQINNVISNFSNLSDTLVAADIAGTITQTNNSLTELSQILEKINSGEGSMGLLVNNDSLYQALAKSAADLDLLLVDIKANPKKYVHFSLFGKKDK